jgi:hypothetical protein
VIHLVVVAVRPHGVDEMLDIAPEKGEPRIRDMLKVLHRPGPEIIDHVDDSKILSLEEAVDQMRPDETGPTGDKD